MSQPRRIVRATSGFFDDLDRQLGADRGILGEPSRTDFQTLELLEIIEVFATQSELLPELIHGRTDYRVLITIGTLVPVITVIGQIAPDDAVELISLHLDFDVGWPGRPGD
ncbi:MAG: hypothetical protein GXP35_10525 [Actinobacteria bacterium]|nr:hypothetical protein [Actinomycetota bacterium]